MFEKYSKLQRCKLKMTKRTYQPSKKRRARRHGFRKRASVGQKVLKKRRN